MWVRIPPGINQEASAMCRGFVVSGDRMSLEARIKRWYYEAQRRGITLQSILIHPNDYDRACRDFPFLPIRVLGQRDS